MTPRVLMHSDVLSTTVPESLPVTWDGKSQNRNRSKCIFQHFELKTLPTEYFCLKAYPIIVIGHTRRTNLTWLVIVLHQSIGDILLYLSKFWAVKNLVSSMYRFCCSKSISTKLLTCTFQLKSQNTVGLVVTVTTRRLQQIMLKMLLVP